MDLLFLSSSSADLPAWNGGPQLCLHDGDMPTKGRTGKDVWVLLWLFLGI